ncbi:MAG TPA: hypothetical protein VIL30_14095, partial [Ramlibacter sp.]
IENATVGLATGAALTGDGGSNVLTGNAGADTLAGGAGADTLEGAGGADQLDGGEGDDSYLVTAGDTIVDAGGTDVVESLASWTLDEGLENVRLAGGAAASATGNAASNLLQGNGAANTLDGAGGADTMEGGAGDDRYRVDHVGDVVLEVDAEHGLDTVVATVAAELSEHVERLELEGSADLAGTGNSLANEIVGNTGANVLDGGTGADTLKGGFGDDTYLVDDAGDALVEAASGGTDTVRATLDWQLGAQLERLVLLGEAVSGTGNTLANRLTGNAANNILDGGAAADSMAGGAGDDHYHVDNAADAVTETAGAGWDSVEATVDTTLAANVERLELRGMALRGTGNAENNVLEGNAQANVLDGATGQDAMHGGAGNDTYHVDDAYDYIAESFNEGIDTVISSIGWSLHQNLENLTLAGSAGLWAAGNELANVIRGNDGDNTLSGVELFAQGSSLADTLEGGAGNDTYDVRHAQDRVVEEAGKGDDTVYSHVASYTLAANVETGRVGGSTAATLKGNAGNNALYGGYGADTLEGGDGADTLSGGGGTDSLKGGAGDDMYILDASADTIIEAAGGGKDTVVVAASFTLASEFENLSLTGASAFNGTGNGAANVLIGNLGRNVLDGAAGADTMKGEGGNDTYKVDHAGDEVVELASEGTDTVESSVSRTLEANVENLTLAGVADIDGTGNLLANTLTGNGGKNILDGGTGADKLAGGAGNDTYRVENAGDDIVGEADGTAGGIDTVVAAIDWSAADDFVENLLAAVGTAAIDLTGNALANKLTGNAGVNVLTGGEGADTLDGGSGADVLAGGLGNDTYYLDNAGDDISGESSAAGDGIDIVRTVVDYSAASDGVEILIASTGTAAIDLTGNALANTLAGNDGTN